MTEQSTTASTEQSATAEPSAVADPPANTPTPPDTPPAEPAPAAAPLVTIAQASAAPAAPAAPAATAEAERLRAEFADLAAIASQAARLGVSVDAADAMKRGVAPEALRRSVLDALASRAEASAVVSAAPQPGPGLVPAAGSPIVKRARERAAAQS